MGHRNPKSGQGDGAGFNRLRAEQARRHNFTSLLNAKHPSADGLYIDQIREYAGAQIVFYRYDINRTQHAAVATFREDDTLGSNILTNDIIVNMFRGA
jgi:hypothetical protein